MRNLFAFLYRNRVFILFLILQIICFILITRQRSYQRSVFLNSSNELTGNVLEEYNSYLKYLDLEQQNQTLAEENARLLNLQKESYFPISKNTLIGEDTVFKTRYEYLTANVVNSSYLKSANYLTVDRGSIHGVEPQMGVLGPEGVVGIVHKVSKHFATVIPLINPRITLSGKFNNSGYYGPVKWLENDYRHITLTDIPRYAKFKTGDTIITDARSLIFPPGHIIGTVVNSELQQDQNFLAVQLKLVTDFSALQHVFIIKDKMKAEREELESKISEDEP